jgi:hypothetical protein
MYPTLFCNMYQQDTQYIRILYSLPSNRTSVGYRVYYHFSDMHWLTVTAIFRDTKEYSDTLANE